MDNIQLVAQELQSMMSDEFRTKFNEGAATAIKCIISTIDTIKEQKLDITLEELKNTLNEYLKTIKK